MLKGVKGLIFLSNSSIDNYIIGHGKSESNDSEISMLAIVNYDGYFGPGPTCTKAFEVALEQLKENGKLSGLNLKFELENSKCDSEKMIKIVADDLTRNYTNSNRLPMMILDECPSFANVAAIKMLKPNYFVGLTTGFKSSNLDFIKKMTTVGIKPEISLVNKAEMEMMLEMGWKKYAVFSEDLSYFNEVEKEMFPKFDSAGLEMVLLSKLNFQKSDQELEKDIDTAMLELKTSGANIIFFHSDYKIHFACCLYKFDMYRNKFIFASAWSLWNPETVDIPNMVSDWCTRDMLKTVIRAWSFESFGWMFEALGNDYIDDAGLTSDQFTEKMSNKIFEPYKSGSWKTWSASCYDLAYYTGLVVDKMEKSLRNSSSSLLDWTVGGENFLKNPSFIQDLMLETIYKVDFKGQMITVDIDEKTHRNRDGWSPVIFRQTLETGDGHFQSDKVAYFRYSDSSFFDINGGFRWATDDGNPPDDQIQVVKQTLPPTSLESFIVFDILSTIVIVTAIVLVFEFHCRKRSRYEMVDIPKANQVLLFALIILVGHSFAIPFTTSHNMVLSCSIAFVCFTFGFSLCLTAVIALNNTTLFDYEKNRWGSSLYFIIPITQLVLSIVLLTPHGLKTGSELVSSEPSIDGRIQYVYHREYCHFPLESQSTFAILSTIGSIFIVLILSMVFSAYTGGHAYKAKRAALAVKLSSSCSYLLTIIIIAFILVAFIKPSFYHLTILGPVISYVAATLMISFIELSRLFKPEIYDDKNRSRKSTLISPPFAFLKKTTIVKP